MPETPEAPPAATTTPTTPASAPPASDAVVTVPTKVETDPSKFLAGTEPAAPPADPRRKLPPAVPSDGTERYRTVGADLTDDREFLELMFKELDGMRIADADARRLKWIVQAMVKRVLDSLPKPVPPPVVASPPSPPAPVVK